MKSILSLIISAALVVSGYSQTRNVLVGTNNAVVQPTNFWSADATNARSGLGLGSAATNAASAFQPASSILSNLVSGGALTFSNVTIGITNVTGLQTALDGKLSTNPTLAISNISNLQTTLDGKLGTNPTLQISNISGLQTNLDSKLSPTGSAANLTNFPTVALASNITGTAALATNVTGVVALTNGGTGATNATGARTALGVGASDVFVGLTNLGTGAGQGFSSSPYILGSTNSTAPNNAVLALGAAGVRSVAGLTLAALTNLDNASFRSAIGLGSSATNASSAFQPSSVVLSNLASSNAVNLTNLRVTNIVGWSAITNTNAATSLLGFTANGQVVANTGTNVLTFTSNVIVDGSTEFSNGDISRSGNAISLENSWLVYNETIVFEWQDSQNITYVPLAFSGTNASVNAAATRTNLGLGATWLTNTSEALFRPAIGLGLTNTPSFAGINIGASTITYGGVSPDAFRISILSNELLVATTNSFSFNAPLVAPRFSASVGGNSVSITNTGILFSGAATANTRTNLGLGWSALTNSNAGTGLVSVNTNGIVVSPTNFWTASPLGRVGYIQYSQPVASGTNQAEAARNLFVFSLTPTIFNVTNTVQLPVTTNGALYGDIAVVVHKGPTNSATIVRNGIDLITLREDNEATSLLYGTNGWDFYPNLAFHEPVYFTTTNATLYAARSRTNLALGATWLTNTNVTNFRTAIGLGASNSVIFQDGSFNFLNVSEDAFFAYAEFASGSNFVQLSPSGIVFSGIATAATRANLGIPLAALTNTNNATFQAAIFNTNTTPTNGANVNAVNFNTAVSWMEVHVFTNGSNTSFRIPLFK